MQSCCFNAQTTKNELMFMWFWLEQNIVQCKKKEPLKFLCATWKTALEVGNMQN